MKTLISTLSILVALVLATVDMQAQRSDSRNVRDNSRDNSRVDNNVKQEERGTPNVGSRNNDRSSRGRSYDVRNDGRHDNRVVKVRERSIRQYPRDRTVIVTHRPDRFEPSIHRDHRIIHHHGNDYRYYNGRYYRPHNGTYVVVAPPRGIRVNVIPNNFLTIMVGRNPYYYYEGVYYRQDPTVNEYEVVDAPMGAIVPELPQDDVRAVVINGKTYFEYDNILYKAVVTRDGVQYKVMGTISDIR